MEQVWQAEFQKLFSQYVPQSWYLLPVVQRPIGVNWQTFVDSAKVRFCCETINSFLTTPIDLRSLVIDERGDPFQSFRGASRAWCAIGRQFETLVPAAILVVLVNIYNRVGQVYYGFQQPPIHKNRRPGKPRNPHNADLCQACRDGVCSERR
ncbi:unnamed protein product [Ixodes hexagonus]